MHAMHMGFGIGALITPMIVNPFLAVLEFRDAKDATNATTQDEAIPADEFIVVRESRVHVAFITIGVSAAVLGLPFLVYPFVKCVRCIRYRLPRNDKTIASESVEAKDYFRRIIHSFNPATYANGNFQFGLFVFIMVLLLYINIVGAEQLFGNFIRTFSVDALKFPRNEASYLDTVYWGSFTLGRFMGSVFSHFLPIQNVLAVDLLTNLGAITLANVIATSSQGALWASTALVGFFIAPLFPAAIAFINTQIEVGGIVLTLVVFATGFGDLLYIWIEGVLYSSYGPHTILYVLLFAAIVICVIAFVMIAVGSRRGTRFKATEQTLVVRKGDSTVDYTHLEEDSSPSG